MADCAAHALSFRFDNIVSSDGNSNEPEEKEQKHNEQYSETSAAEGDPDPSSNIPTFLSSFVATTHTNKVDSHQELREQW